MLSCQEMSQSLPTTADTTENMQHQRYQGIANVPAEARSATGALTGCASGTLFAMSYPPGTFPTEIQLRNPQFRKFKALCADHAIRFTETRSPDKFNN
jgi:hypothetical protein